MLVCFLYLPSKVLCSCLRNLLSPNSRKQKMLATPGLFPSETNDGTTSTCKDHFLTVFVSFPLHLYVSVVIDPFDKDTLHIEVDTSQFI